jgi:hypothetical protein
MATLPTGPTTLTPLNAADREYLIELVKEMLVAEYRREAKNDTERHDELKGKIPCTQR